jgi:hypothetical protein
VKQKKVMEEKSKINEASVKTKVRMTDNRDAQQRREVENTELCVCMNAICAHFREVTATGTKKAVLSYRNQQGIQFT